MHPLKPEVQGKVSVAIGPNRAREPCPVGKRRARRRKYSDETCGSCTLTLANVGVNHCRNNNTDDHKRRVPNALPLDISFVAISKAKT